jgi:hypothetical protein
MTTLTLVASHGVRVPTQAPERRPGARPVSLHLTRRGRLVLVLLALVVAVAGTLVATRAAAAGPTSAPEVERYVVAPGDTLWQIASGVARPGEDLRDVVQRIELLNNLPSASLIAGQEIVLPLAG